jgi:hypothetical protein
MEGKHVVYLFICFLKYTSLDQPPHPIWETKQEMVEEDEWKQLSEERGGIKREEGGTGRWKGFVSLRYLYSS